MTLLFGNIQIMCTNNWFFQATNIKKQQKQETEETRNRKNTRNKRNRNRKYETKSKT